MAEKPYLSYYGAHGIIPVQQDTTDLNRHLSRRRALYRHLGIHPSTLRNRTILEFGPGTGDNALFIAWCAPKLCVLVDGNPASIQAVSAKLETGLLPADHFECHMSDILEYTDARQFDFVLCEGVLPGQDSPAAFLTHVASFASQDGMVAITTMSAASSLAEVCRRVLKSVLSTRIAPADSLLEDLTRFFARDLSSIAGMSRRHEDWVLDNILHPWPAQTAFTIRQAIETLAGSFDVLGTSPHFIQDWRWYKAIPGHERTWNDVALEEYERWAPYLLDYRVQPDRPIVGMTVPLDRLCEAAFAIHHEIWTNDAVDRIPQFVGCMREIREVIGTVLPETAQSITDFLYGLDQLLDGNSESDFGSFRSWFGRSEQYVSFLRA